MVSSFLFFSCHWNVTYVPFLFFYRLRLEWPAWVLGFRMVSIRFLHSFALRRLLMCYLLLFFRDALISAWNAKSKLKCLFFFCLRSLTNALFASFLRGCFLNLDFSLSYEGKLG